MKQLFAATFDQLQRLFSLSDTQIIQFQTYARLLKERAAEINLTTRTREAEIIEYHFVDSLALTCTAEFASITGFADIGSGAGFPGIPLKIMYPDISVVLVEVLKKRRHFLEEIINTLDLKNIIVSDLDWRQFLRTTQFPINAVVARASLPSVELVRMFRTTSHYQNCTLFYWGAREWNCTVQDKEFYRTSFWYTLSERTRQIAIFQKPIE